MADNTPLRFGVFVPQGWRMDLAEINDPVEKYEAMTRVAQAADAIPAFDSIWLYDHFHTVPTPTLETTFECWTITAALARDTRRVKIGQMVTCNGYRNPALLAKIASTTDVLSHGRLYCGIGAGWYEHEWRAYGYDFPETRDRMRAFREACEIIVKMWTEDYPTFTGEYYRIDKPINEPKGVQKPHPSLWIGGSGPQVTLKLVAQYGDASNTGGTPEEVRQKLDILKRHCDTLGRDYDSLIHSTNIILFLLKPGDDPEKATELARQATNTSYEEFTKIALVVTPDQAVERLQQYKDIGVNYINFYMPGIAYDHTPLQLFADEVAPKLA